jgi:Fe-S cluster assembly iron-binding protein IscA
MSRLLALTENAVEAVKEIVSASEAAPETGGLRMAAESAGARTNLQLSVVELPAEDDEVIEEEGARLFLDEEAAQLLDDKVLDASMDGRPGRLHARRPDVAVTFRGYGFPYPRKSASTIGPQPPDRHSGLRWP